jgi:hypothetical protein
MPKDNKSGAHAERRPEGKEGAGAHQEGKHSVQAGQTNRRASGDPQKAENARSRNSGGDTGRKSPNDHQKTVQGKNQQGPADKVGRDVGGGNAGSKGQNADEPMSQREKLTGKRTR